MKPDCTNVDWYKLLGNSIVEYGVEQGIKEIFQAEDGEFVFVNFVDFLDADLYYGPDTTLMLIEKLLESYLTNYNEQDRLKYIMNEITKENNNE